MTNAVAMLCLLVNVSFFWLCHLRWLNPASSRLLMWESPSLLSQMTHHRDEFLQLIRSGRPFFFFSFLCKGSVLPMQNTAELSSCNREHPFHTANLLQRGKQSALWCMKKWLEFQRRTYIPDVRGRFKNCLVTAVDYWEDCGACIA